MGLVLKKRTPGGYSDRFHTGMLRPRSGPVTLSFTKFWKIGTLSHAKFRKLAHLSHTFPWKSSPFTYLQPEKGKYTCRYYIHCSSFVVDFVVDAYYLLFNSVISVLAVLREASSVSIHIYMLLLFTNNAFFFLAVYDVLTGKIKANLKGHISFLFVHSHVTHLW